MLTASQIERYADDGCLVLPGFKSLAEIDALRRRAVQIVEAFDPGPRHSVFTTHDQARTANAEFLASGAAIHCFFEEQAFDANGELTQPKALSINKIGHAMHDLDPVFERFSHGPELVELASDLGLQQAALWQSMFIFKQPGIGGEVKWHQDASFLDTTPASVIGLWFALEDATLENGCLWVAPGGHKGPLRERFVREPFADGFTSRNSPDGMAHIDAVRMQALDATPWPDASQALPLQVPAGSLVVLHGRLPHYSAHNRSARSRHAYTLHAADANCIWSPANWLQRGPELPLRGFS